LLYARITNYVTKLFLTKKLAKSVFIYIFAHINIC